MLQVLTSVSSGEVSGSTTAKQLPNVPARRVFIQAVSTNAGSVYIGGPGVTIPDGTTDTTSGIQLEAGKGLDLWIENLNLLYIICDNAGDDITYLVNR